jgi:hypothetical protein
VLRRSRTPGNRDRVVPRRSARAPSATATAIASARHLQKQTGKQYGPDRYAEKLVFLSSSGCEPHSNQRHSKDRKHHRVDGTEATVDVRSDKIRRRRSRVDR